MRRINTRDLLRFSSEVADAMAYISEKNVNHELSLTFL
jgi:hypothetical protein